MNSDRIGEAAALLQEAREKARPLRAFPDALRPQTLQDAYAVQDAVLSGLGSIGEWKLSAKSAPVAWQCAPLPASTFTATVAGIGSLDLKIA